MGNLTDKTIAHLREKLVNAHWSAFRLCTEDAEALISEVIHLRKRQNTGNCILCAQAPGSEPSVNVDGVLVCESCIELASMILNIDAITSAVKAEREECALIIDERVQQADDELEEEVAIPVIEHLEGAAADIRAQGES